MSAVLWFAVWTVLVLAAVVVGLLLWRQLWRKVKALGSELERAGSALAGLEARAAELAREPAAPRLPALADPVLLDAVRARRLKLRAARCRRADGRTAAAVQRWRELGLVR